MWKIAALAWMPIAAVLFGLQVAIVTHIPGVTGDFDQGAMLIYGSAVLSALVAVPLAWYVARRMLSRQERRRLDAGMLGARGR